MQRRRRRFVGIAHRRICAAHCRLHCVVPWRRRRRLLWRLSYQYHIIIIIIIVAVLLVLALALVVVVVLVVEAAVFDHPSDDCHQLCCYSALAAIRGIKHTHAERWPFVMEMQLLLP